MIRCKMIPSYSVVRIVERTFNLGYDEVELLASLKAQLEKERVNIEDEETLHLELIDKRIDDIDNLLKKWTDENDQFEDEMLN